ncbi:MAG: DUF5916 domain-containing protein [Gemmatimonadota bacterium]
MGSKNRAGLSSFFTLNLQATHDTCPAAHRPGSKLRDRSSALMHTLMLALLLTPLSPRPVATSNVAGDSAPGLRIHATRVSASIHLDGHLDEPAWNDATPIREFFQVDPDEGQPSTEATEVRILLGSDALYVGARLMDRHIGSLNHRLGRRDDETAADAFAIELDPLFDRLHGFRFQVGPDGTMGDAAVSPSGEQDASWDPIWDASTSIDSLGWTAEIRIPLSQLRFNAGTDAWGIQLERFLLRRLERSYSTFTPKRELPGSRMTPGYYGELVDMAGLASSHQVEILPYVSVSASYVHDPEAGSILQDPSGEYAPRAGADVHARLTSDLSLNASLYPDFGQVEVDPAVVNLSAFETRFPEKRPFFVESADRFEYGRLRAYEQAGQPTVFYSRRIGRSPQVSPFRGSGIAFADSPERTDIIGAAKLIGRSRGGWTTGLLDAVTSAEYAQTLSSAGQVGRTQVEPLTNYFVGRVSRDLRNGETSIGGLFTSVNRENVSGIRDVLTSSAYVGGLDVSHSWANRTWGLDGYLAASRVGGTSAAIGRVQRASARYFQRPDSRHDQEDSTRTFLTGYDGEIALTRLAGNWVGSVVFQDVSPGYETNDAGLLLDAGRRNVSLDLHYRHFKPGRFFQNYIIWPFTDHQWNYDGQIVRNRFNFYFQGELRNRWATGVEYDYFASVYDDRLTRGGPVVRRPAIHHFYYSVTSPARGRLSLQSQAIVNHGEEGSTSITWSNSLVIQARSNVQFHLSPTITLDREQAQFVGRYDDATATETFGTRTVFAHLRQRSVGLETRLDWILTRKLTLQTYAQQLIAANRFERYKVLLRPGGYSFGEYGKDLGSAQENASGDITLDADGSGPAPSFTTPRPDFTLRSLLLNVVLRWEFRPGSTLFAVWQHQGGSTATTGDLQLSTDVNGLFAGPADNVLAVKIAYWMNR